MRPKHLFMLLAFSMSSVFAGEPDWICVRESGSAAPAQPTATPAEQLDQTGRSWYLTSNKISGLLSPEDEKKLSAAIGGPLPEWLCLVPAEVINVGPAPLAENEHVQKITVHTRGGERYGVIAVPGEFAVGSQVYLISTNSGTRVEPAH